MRDKVRAKLKNVREKGYIRPGKVVSLTGYFAVPKGTSNVQMVYDASRSKLNDALWAPNETLLRGVTFSTWMGDIDLAEMFLNYCLDESLHEFCGVDVGPYFKYARQKTKWERWICCLMGLKVSPYLTIKGLLLGLEWVLGDTLDKNNVLHWTKVRLNLPGDSCYDPGLPWVSKVKEVEGQGELAALLVAYVDDLRVAGASEEECWRVMHHICSRLSFLGLQVASRKTRPPSQSRGPWVGSVVSTDGGRVCVSCTPAKWDKAKGMLNEMLARVRAGEPLDCKTLEQHRGSLVHIQQTYPTITPYLKGLHLMIDSWRDGRDSAGWKLPHTPQSMYWDNEQGTWVLQEQSCPSAPSLVNAVPRLERDLTSLLHLMSP